MLVRRLARRQAQAFYRARFGDLTLGQLRAPTYAPIWNVEHNGRDFVGPRTDPDMPVARAIRMAVSLPLFVQPVLLDGLSCHPGQVTVTDALDLTLAIDHNVGHAAPAARFGAELWTLFKSAAVISPST